MSVKVTFIAALLIISTCALAQEQQESPEAVEVIGLIVNSLNKEPVIASITYESMPYGNKIGVFKGSNFTFRIDDGSDYSVRVQAAGYNPYTGMVKNDGSKIKKLVVELTPEGSKQQHVIRLEELIFAVRSDVITEKSHAELDQIVAMLNADKDMKIQLEGHTDWQGNAKQNLKLSERRVGAVKNYIVAKGVSKKRIKTKAFGGTKPLSRARDKETREKNRRVEVRILTSN